MRKIFCGGRPRVSDVSVFERAGAFVLGLLFLLGLFAGELRAQEEFLGMSAGRRGAIVIMSREISAAMTPWKIKGPVRKATQYSRYIWDACELYTVDPFLVAALICVESEGRADAAVSTRVGLMQVSVQENMAWITQHLPHIKTVDDLMRVRNNVMAGTFALSALMQSTDSAREALYKYLGEENERKVDRILDIVGRMNTAALARKK